MESKSGSHNKLELIKGSNVLSSSIEQAVYEKFANEHNLTHMVQRVVNGSTNVSS